MALSSPFPQPPGGADAVHALIEPLFQQGLQFHSQGEQIGRASCRERV